MNRPSPYLFASKMFALMLFAVFSTYGQSFVIPVDVNNDADSVETREIAFGAYPGANLCINPPENPESYGGYQEIEAPPAFGNVLDIRFVAYSNDHSTLCYDETYQGVYTEFRPIVMVGQKDTFKVVLNMGDNGAPVHLNWNAANVALYTNSCKMYLEVSPGVWALLVDMQAASTWDLVADASYFIEMEPIVNIGPGSAYFSIPPDTIISKDPIKGKFWKAAKRPKPGKPFINPTWANLLAEVVIQGGFQPNSSESDGAGGMRIGISHMFDAGGNKWKVTKDSAKTRGWVRVSKWNFKKLAGSGWADLQKTLETKAGKHINYARGLDSTLNPGDLKRKPFLKQWKKVDPKKHNNKLYAELLAFKFNIAASALEKTPVGFGDLIYDNDGHIFDEMSLLDIAAEVDTAMSYWQGVDPQFYVDAWQAIYDVNRAFPGSILDTVSWTVDTKLVMNGVVSVNDVPFLKEPAVFAPTRITPTNNFTESDDWEDEYDEDADALDGTPLAVKLFQNYPNPFNPSTTIAFRLQSDALVNISVYNMLGQQVGMLVTNEDLSEGINTITFDATGLASGTYFYRVTGQSLDNGESLMPVVGKMLLVK